MLSIQSQTTNTKQQTMKPRAAATPNNQTTLSRSHKKEPL
jgi:hypothetical protein